jgi:hypothetical protein
MNYNQQSLCRGEAGIFVFLSGTYRPLSRGERTNHISMITTQENSPFLAVNRQFPPYLFTAEVMLLTPMPRRSSGISSSKVNELLQAFLHRMIKRLCLRLMLTEIYGSFCFDALAPL